MSANLFNPHAPATLYIRFQAKFWQINPIRIAKIFCGRCLVNLIITFWRSIFFHKYKYFSSFGAGNCASNSSFKWMKNSLKKSGSVRVKQTSHCTKWKIDTCLNNDSCVLLIRTILNIHKIWFNTFLTYIYVAFKWPFLFIFCELGEQ